MDRYTKAQKKRLRQPRDTANKIIFSANDEINLKTGKAPMVLD